ncbi:MULTISPECIES: DUF1659 domain-containing protein [Enterococcus]|uniref:DUF1659 domain-containing protein n=1 Tax=Enterococcus TaxID=1350 RepID=UPI00065DCEE4|nr:MULTISPECIES: hypothetical protein [Enterococcus]KAF1302985.1 hypothetical protein BAU16_05780 [Enterococcus sp. JM9B]
MKTHVSTELGIMYQEDGKEKLTKQRFANVVAVPSETEILALGDAMDQLAPNSAVVVSVIETVATQHTK